MVNQIFILPLQSTRARTRPDHGVRMISYGEEVVKAMNGNEHVYLQIVLLDGMRIRLMCKHMQCLVIDIIIIAGS